MRHAGLVIAASILAVAPMAAQDKGTFEIGGFGRYTKYTEAYEIRKPDDNRFGGGARIGLFVANNLAIELDGSFNPTDLAGNQPNVPSTIGFRSVPLQYFPFHLQLVYNAPLTGGISWMIGGGPGYTKLKKGINEGNVSVGAMTGLRLRPAKWLNFRLEGTADVLPSGFGEGSNTYLGAQLGASLMLGGGCDHSKDMIGIRPASASLTPGQSQQFTAESWYCGKADQVTYMTSGPGTVDAMSGLYTSAGDGCATVTATSKKGKLTSSANVCTKTPVAVPPPAPVRPAPPPPPAPVKPAYTFELSVVNFRFDHSDLTRGGMDTLNTVATTLKSHPEVNVDVVGHTDWVGTNAYNMKLSQARAETVRKYLISQGVAADRIMVKWRGEEEPTATNDTAEGRAKNRRAEIKQNN
ncbi:MAG: OmpA family protein [Gemmatimonadota bacterium]